MSGATPGQYVTGLVVLLGLSLIVLLFSMNRHIKRVKFEEKSDNS